MRYARTVLAISAIYFSFTTYAQTAAGSPSADPQNANQPVQSRDATDAPNPQEAKPSSTSPDEMSRQAALPKLKADAANPLKHLTQFSAVMVGSMVGNIDETHIYRSGDLIRTELPHPPVKYFVTNLSTSETIALLPKHCISNRAPLAYTFPFTFFRRGYVYQREPLGEETVDGHHSQVERIIRTSSDGASIARVKFWEADDLKGFPIKVEMDLGPRVITITYKDVKLELPDPALFKHPTSCEQAQNPRR